MKKILIVILCLVILMSFSAFAEKTNQADENNNNASESLLQESRYITPEEVNFDCSAKVPAKGKGPFIDGYGIADRFIIFRSPEEAVGYSDLIIRGRVEESQYVIGDTGSLDTKSIVVVDEVYKGDAKVGDKVTVMEGGGFVPNGKYMNVVYMEKFGKEAANKDDPTILDFRFNGEKVMEKGEKVFLLLKTYNEGYTGVWEKLLYHEDIDAYAPYIPESDKDIVEAKIYKENQLASIVQDAENIN